MVEFAFRLLLCCFLILFWWFVDDLELQVSYLVHRYLVDFQLHTDLSDQFVRDGFGQALVCEQELEILKSLLYQILPSNRDPQPFRNLFALVW